MNTEELPTNQPPKVANRNLVNACKRFYDNWLPVNPEALERIKDGLVSNAYELDPDFFFEDLKTDIGLFTYYLRQARRVYQQKKGDSTPLALHPRELFSSLSREDQISIFNIRTQDVSEHSLKKASRNQALQLRELVISNSATETLATHNNVDGLLGYSVSSLNQIGRTLIAWNYPKLYEEALAQAKDPRRLDEVLTLSLGFSPQLLVVALARDWGLSKELRAALGDIAAIKSLKENQSEGSQTKQVATMLEKVYEVGATLARAHTPEIYPSAEEDWKSAKKAVEFLVGPDGLKSIQKQVKENCYHYLKAAPEIFEPAVKLEPSTIISLEITPELFLENRYIKSCSKDAQDALLGLYVQVSEKSISKPESIKTLIKGIAPLMGFPRGCVYLLEPETMKLTCRLNVEGRKLDTYKQVHAFNVSTRGANPIGAAYNCNSPIIQNDYALSGFGETCFATVLGKHQRVGVLYLEPNEALVEAHETNLLQRFKAIAVAFEHFLGIS